MEVPFQQGKLSEKDATACAVLLKRIGLRGAADVPPGDEQLLAMKPRIFVLGEMEVIDGSSRTDFPAIQTVAETIIRRAAP